MKYLDIEEFLSREFQRSQEDEFMKKYEDVFNESVNKVRDAISNYMLHDPEELLSIDFSAACVAGLVDLIDEFEFTTVFKMKTDTHDFMIGNGWETYELISVNTDGFIPLYKYNRKLYMIAE